MVPRISIACDINCLNLKNWFFFLYGDGFLCDLGNNPPADDSDKENPNVTDSSPLFAVRKRTKKSVSARARSPPGDPTPVTSRRERRKPTVRH